MERGLSQRYTGVRLEGGDGSAPFTGSVLKRIIRKGSCSSVSTGIVRTRRLTHTRRRRTKEPLSTGSDVGRVAVRTLVYRFRAPEARGPCVGLTGKTLPRGLEYFPVMGTQGPLHVTRTRECGDWDPFVKEIFESRKTVFQDENFDGH